MSTERSKAVVRRIYDELIAEGGRNYDTGLTARPFGHEEIKGTVRMVSRGFPDNVHRVEEMIAEGDMVVVRVRLTGTREGEFTGIPPTGRRIEITEIHIYRSRDGQAVEHRVGRDDLGAMRQLGIIADAIPSPGPPRESEVGA